jgi:hypothetical protein
VSEQPIAGGGWETVDEEAGEVEQEETALEGGDLPYGAGEDDYEEEDFGGETPERDILEGDFDDDEH